MANRKMKAFRNKRGQIVGFRRGSPRPYKTGARLIKSGRAKRFKVVKGRFGSSVLLLKR